MTYKHLFSLGRAKGALLLLFLFITSFTSIIHAQADEDCMMCHEDRELTGMLNGRNVSMFVDTSIFAHSVHHSNTCLSCHADAAEEGFPHADDLKPVNCGNCHTRELTENRRGVHGQQPCYRGCRHRPHEDPGPLCRAGNARTGKYER